MPHSNVWCDIYYSCKSKHCAGCLIKYANLAIKIYLNKQNKIRPTSGEKFTKRCDGVTFCGSAKNQ